MKKLTAKIQHKTRRKEEISEIVQAFRKIRINVKNFDCVKYLHENR